MNGRAFAVTMLVAGAVTSFAMAMWSASHGRLPIVEMAHAVMFTVMAAILASVRSGEKAGCLECGTPIGEEAFCLHCGRFPGSSPYRPTAHRAERATRS